MALVAAIRLQKRGANAVSFKSFGVACVLLRGRRRRPCVCRIPRSGDKCAVRVCVRACVLCFVFGGVSRGSCLVFWFAVVVACLPGRRRLRRVVLGSVASRCGSSACWLFVAGVGGSPAVAVPCCAAGRASAAVVGSAVVPAWLPAVVRVWALGCRGRGSRRAGAVGSSVVSASRSSRLRLLACLPSGGLFFYACETTKATDESLVA